MYVYEYFNSLHNHTSGSIHGTGRTRRKRRAFVVKVPSPKDFDVVDRKIATILQGLKDNVFEINGVIRYGIKAITEEVSKHIRIGEGKIDMGPYLIQIPQWKRVCERCLGYFIDRLSGLEESEQFSDMVTQLRATVAYLESAPEPSLVIPQAQLPYPEGVQEELERGVFEAIDLEKSLSGLLPGDEPGYASVRSFLDKISNLQGLLLAYSHYKGIAAFRFQ